MKRKEILQLGEPSVHEKSSLLCISSFTIIFLLLFPNTEVHVTDHVRTPLRGLSQEKDYVSQATVTTLSVSLTLQNTH